jgi:uncharacterized membrane protein (UPF0127 family)
MRRTLLALAALALSVSCGYGAEARGGREGSGDGTSDRYGFGHGTVIIDKGRETVLVEVEVAQTDRQRARGLMFRKSLPEDAGMVFVYFSEQEGAFWMKNTRIPLSIAFFGRGGRILRILDMEPCRKDPCKLYDPDVGFWGALEVNRGAFDRWEVEEGDVINITQ